MTKKGVLLVNLGSPDSPSVPDVRRYLRQFLMDGRVLDAPWPVRFCVVHFAILPKRPRDSAHAYQQIWTAEGSPLVATSRKVLGLLQSRVALPVALAMRYQNPSIENGVRELRDQGVDDLLVIPLFPHYAMSSFESAAVRAEEVAAQLAPGMKVTIQPPFYDDPEYLEALAANAAEYLEREYDHLLFSYHGLPERHLRKSDPTGRHCLASAECCTMPCEAHRTCYRAQAFRTVEEFVKRTGVTKYSISFQSRLGRDPWLKPYTDLELPRLAAAGVRRILVMCPAFVSDCLETIEEIGLRGRELFRQAGGEELTLVPCLNEHPLWIAALEKYVARFAAGTGAVFSIS